MPHRRLPISDQDIADIVRLVGDIAGMTEPLVERRRRLMERLAEMIGAHLWAWSISRGMREGTPAPLAIIDGGFTDEAQHARMWQASSQPDVVAACAPPELLDVHNTHIFDASHPGWQDGTIMKRYIEPMGLSCSMFSIYPVDHDVISAIGMHRRTGHPPFTPRERTLMHLVLGQIDWLHRSSTDVAANTPEITKLSPRQSEILIYLLKGQSPEQIAEKTALSEYTIGDYIKRVYRHFKVNSRGELMAKFIG